MGFVLRMRTLGGWRSLGTSQIVVVSAPADVQRERVLARPGMTPEKFDHILSLQMPDAEKRARANHVIDTGTSLEITESAVNDLVKSLLGKRIHQSSQPD